jgi:cytidylate kinase
LIAPVIAVDGPSGSGKGSLCQSLARELGWHLLDSGALYRIVGLAAVKRGTSFDDEKALAVLAAGLNVEFRASEPGEPAAVILDGEDVSSEVRNETSGSYASRVAVYPAVRDALTGLQRSFAKSPGLIADGRDMGTVIFPDAPLKIFLTASAEERAGRRYKQLINKGQSVTLAAVLKDIQARDERDMNRIVAPLKPADNAIVLDSTSMALDEVFLRVIEEYRKSL